MVPVIFKQVGAPVLAVALFAAVPLGSVVGADASSNTKQTQDQQKKGCCVIGTVSSIDAEQKRLDIDGARYHGMQPAREQRASSFSARLQGPGNPVHLDNRSASLDKLQPGDTILVYVDPVHFERRAQQPDYDVVVYEVWAAREQGEQDLRRQAGWESEQQARDRSQPSMTDRNEVARRNGGSQMGPGTPSETAAIKPIRTPKVAIGEPEKPALR